MWKGFFVLPLLDRRLQPGQVYKYKELFLIGKSSSNGDR